MSFGFGFSFPAHPVGHGLWTPAQLSASLWLDANDANTITLNGTTVSQWSDKSGNVRNATQSTSANQPLYVTGQNYLLYSEQFQQTAWAKAGVLVTANAALAPDRTLTADKIAGTAAAGTHVIFNTSALSLSASVFTWVIRAKAAEHNFMTLGSIYGSVRYTVTFNLTTGAVTKTATANLPTGTANSAKFLGDGWWELSVSMTAGTGAFTYYIAASSPTGTPTQDAQLNVQYTGDGVSGAYIWGAQINSGSSATTYQKTEAVAITSGTVNTIPAIKFDGTNDIMLLPNNTIPSGDTNYSMFVAMQWDSTAPQFVVGTGTNTGPATANYLAGISATPATFGSWWQGYGGGVSGTISLGPVFYGAWYDNGTSVVSVNRNGGTSTDTNQLVDRNSMTTSHVIGSFSNGTSPLNGSIGEIVITQSVLSTVVRQKMEGYLAWKWGLQGSLPVGHPYKNAPPTV